MNEIEMTLQPMSFCVHICGLNKHLWFMPKLPKLFIKTFRLFQRIDPQVLGSATQKLLIAI